MEGLDKNSLKYTSVDDNSQPSDLLPILIPSKSLENLMKEREKLDEERKNMYLKPKYVKYLEKNRKKTFPNNQDLRNVDNIIYDKRSLTEKCEDLKFERSMSDMNIGGPKRTFSEISSSTTWQDTVIKNEIKKKRQDEEELVKEYMKNNKYYYYEDGDCYVSYDIPTFRLLLEPRIVKRRINRDRDKSKDKSNNELIYDGSLLVINDKITDVPYTNEFGNIKYNRLTLDEYHQKYCEEREDEDGTKKWYYLDK